MPTAAADRDDALAQLALEKLVRVLGPARGRRLFDDVLAELGLERLATPDDLYAFGQRLGARGGFEAAVGSLIEVAAVVRGAAGR
jgi:hypothetical protein